LAEQPFAVSIDGGSVEEGYAEVKGSAHHPSELSRVLPAVNTRKRVRAKAHFRKS
jgi:hypothetical protein